MTETQTSPTQAFIDPICGMQVEPATAAGSFNQDGETFYFCPSGCLQKIIAPTDDKPASCCGGN